MFSLSRKSLVGLVCLSQKLQSGCNIARSETVIWANHSYINIITKATISLLDDVISRVVLQQHCGMSRVWEIRPGFSTYHRMVLVAYTVSCISFIQGLRQIQSRIPYFILSPEEGKRTRFRMMDIAGQLVQTAHHMLQYIIKIYRSVTSAVCNCGKNT
jgi:hypothetical protein